MILRNFKSKLRRHLQTYWVLLYLNAIYIYIYIYISHIQQLLEKYVLSILVINIYVLLCHSYNLFFVQKVIDENDSD